MPDPIIIYEEEIKGCEGSCATMYVSFLIASKHKLTATGVREAIAGAKILDPHVRFPDVRLFTPQNFIHAMSASSQSTLLF